jgi:hypothetical protein
MIMTSKQLAALLRIKQRQFYRFIREMGLEYTINKSGRQEFDTNSQTCRVFWDSVNLALKNRHLYVFYNKSQLSKMSGHHRDTIQRRLINEDVPITQVGKSKYFFLVHLKEMNLRRKVSQNR